MLCNKKILDPIQNITLITLLLELEIDNKTFDNIHRSTHMKTNITIH
jgi:hypothetical protein